MVQSSEFTSSENSNQALFDVIYDQTYYGETLDGIQSLKKASVTSSNTLYASFEQ
jgi:hypothetical protein